MFPQSEGSPLICKTSFPPPAICFSRARHGVAVALNADKRVNILNKFSLSETLKNEQKAQRERHKFLNVKSNFRSLAFQFHSLFQISIHELHESALSFWFCFVFLRVFRGWFLLIYFLENYPVNIKTKPARCSFLPTILNITRFAPSFKWSSPIGISGVFLRVSEYKSAASPTGTSVLKSGILRLHKLPSKSPARALPVLTSTPMT